MKPILLTVLFSIAICIGCEKDPVIVKGYYDSMHFVRQGGGQIDFSIYPNEKFDQVNAVVTKSIYRDTTILIIIPFSDDFASTFSSLEQAMNNQIQINGAFQQSTLSTGTWSYVYMVDNANEVEVTNIDLRDSLSKFEQLVKEKIP